MNPLNLTEMFLQAQNGQAVANMAKQFGLSEEQAEAAVRNLMPAFSAGFQRNMTSPMGMIDLMTALSGGRHARYFDDAGTLGQNETRDEGNAILGHLFGSPEVSRAVAQHAAAQAGLGSTILKAMLPYIASIIMGAIFKKGQNPIGDILGEILGGGSAQAGRRGGGAQSGGRQSDDVFGEISDIYRKQIDPMGRGGTGHAPDMPDASSYETSQPDDARGQQAPQFPGGADIFKDIFGSDGNKSPFEDILNDMLGGGRRR